MPVSCGWLAAVANRRGTIWRDGAGLVFAEATAVSPEGRISLGDTGLWNDAQQ